MDDENKIDDGGPAFPVPMVGGIQAAVSVEHAGLSLRDYFAAKAMTKLMRQYRHPDAATLISQAAYAMADVMIVARKVVQS